MWVFGFFYATFLFLRALYFKLSLRVKSSSSEIDIAMYLNLLE